MKDIFLLERTKDSVSNIIGFYSSEERAVEAVKRHVLAHIDEAVKESIDGSDHVGIYISEGFLISRNEVEVDEDAEFSKIEDPQEFPAERTPSHGRALQEIAEEEAGCSQDRVKGREYEDGTA